MVSFGNEKSYYSGGKSVKELAEILLSSETIAARVKELGAEITTDYQGKEIIIIGILKGALPFMADLIREINIPLKYDLMAVSSYGVSTKTSGAVQILKDIEMGIEGEHVLVVEDIIDTGLTLNYLVGNLLSRKPASLKICTLLDKPSRREVEIFPQYNGFTIPDRFVVGYGLDYAERFRHLPMIGVLKPEVYEKK
ncbi:MAG TPA: hypoxanthine phosphoribosyltransferase [Firmicutes bacterium]|nr:hypoxanthine phosphoribosyltransferase [Bacillota bacterium]